MENGVTYEKTCTGINMLPNILAYIKNKGFIPCGRSKNNIFFEKDLSQDIDKKTLAKVYKMFCNNKNRKEAKTVSALIEEIKEVKEFDVFTNEQKRKLANSFLKDDELRQAGISEGLIFIKSCFRKNAERLKRAFEIEGRVKGSVEEKNRRSTGKKNGRNIQKEEEER